MICAALRVSSVLGQHPGPAGRLLPPEPPRRRGEHILLAGEYKLNDQELIFWIANLTQILYTCSLIDDQICQFVHTFHIGDIRTQVDAVQEAACDLREGRVLLLVQDHEELLLLQETQPAACTCR